MVRNVLDDDWAIRPAGGLTGDAFMAEKGNERLFLKRNSAPFLAVLSAEGIAPKLIWTKRMENGDVITAQKWLEGRKLEPEEMKGKQVADILHKIHNSAELLNMLMRLGKRAKTPDEKYNNIVIRLQNKHIIPKYDEIRIALVYLQRLLPVTRGQKQVVCHCDLNHNNLLITEDEQLFLIDWDNANISDPVIDFGSILKWYVPETEWDDWLGKYGLTNNQQIIERMYWYLLYNTLYYIDWHYERNEYNKVMERMQALQEINEDIRSTILN